MSSSGARKPSRSPAGPSGKASSTPNMTPSSNPGSTPNTSFDEKAGKRRVRRRDRSPQKYGGESGASDGERAASGEGGRRHTPPSGSPEPSPQGSPARRRRQESCKLQVTVRVRPLLQYEKDGKKKKKKGAKDGFKDSFGALDAAMSAGPPPGVQEDIVLRHEDRHVLVLDPDTYEITNQHTVDKVFWSVDGDCDNKAVYEYAGRPALHSALDAFNVCLFAYGQTGSGKTHTMLGHGQQEGIAPLMIRDLFEEIQKRTVPGLQFQVLASFMEIYNERVRDLFDTEGADTQSVRVQPQMRYTDASSSSLPAILAAQYKERKVREHPVRGIFVDGLTATKVSSAQHCMRTMKSGLRERCTSATKLNQTSSRSHAIFQIKLVMNDANTGVHRCSTINVVDLAGSENVNRSGAAGATFEEAASINQSLSTLRLVFDKLIESQRPRGSSVHIPYRDSVLTRVLQDSLGGNSKTVMIANVSPHSSNVVETRSTLSYAVKAQAITCTLRRNEEKNTSLVAGLRTEVDMLRQQMESLRDQGHLSEDTRATIEKELDEELKRRLSALDEQKAMLAEERAQVGRELESQMGETRRAQVLGLWQKGALAGRVSAVREQVNALEQELAEERSLRQQAQERARKLSADASATEALLRKRDVEVGALRRMLGQTAQQSHSTGRRRLGDTTARLIASVVCSEPAKTTPGPTDSTATALDALRKHTVDKTAQDPVSDIPEAPLPQGVLPVSLAEISEKVQDGEEWVVVVGDGSGVLPHISAARSEGAVVYVKLGSEAAREALIQAAC